jgi:hypothetical protein
MLQHYQDALLTTMIRRKSAIKVKRSHTQSSVSLKLLLSWPLRSRRQPAQPRPKPSDFEVTMYLPR